MKTQEDIQSYTFQNREGKLMMVTLNGNTTPWIWEVA